jgi:hypothetical protein
MRETVIIDCMSDNNVEATEMCVAGSQIFQSFKRSAKCAMRKCSQESKRRSMAGSKLT